MDNTAILHPGAKIQTVEEGYYFVLMEYTDGRVAFTEERFSDEVIAARRAAYLNTRPRIKRATVQYQASIFDEIDVKKFL